MYVFSLTSGGDSGGGNGSISLVRLTRSLVITIVTCGTDFGGSRSTGRTVSVDCVVIVMTLLLDNSTLVHAGSNSGGGNAKVPSVLHPQLYGVCVINISAFGGNKSGSTNRPNGVSVPWVEIVTTLLFDGIMCALIPSSGGVSIGGSTVKVLSVVASATLSIETVVSSLCDFSGNRSDGRSIAMT